MQGDVHQVLQTSDRRNSLLDEVELLGLEVVGSGLDLFGDNLVVFLADTDDVLLVRVKLLFNEISFF